jgi:hypothetical protein
MNDATLVQKVWHDAPVLRDQPGEEHTRRVAANLQSARSTTVALPPLGPPSVLGGRAVLDPRDKPGGFAAVRGCGS